MKMRHLVKVLLMSGTLAAVLTACGGAGLKYDSGTAAYETAAVDNDAGSYMFSNAAATAEEAEYGYDDMSEAGESAAEASRNALASRKLIKNVNLNVETEQFDVLVPSLENRIAALGGYIEDMSSYSRNDNYSSDYIGTKYLRYASMTVRMPKENLDRFLDEVGEQTNIVSRSENVTDVTLQYVDLESHKKALTAEQDRLLELMEQAQTVEDIITIEGRLSEVRYQIESMESQLRTYDNKIDYSTIYLSIDEVERYTPTEEVTTGERIRNGFMDSVRGVGRGLSNFAIWFIVNIPYLIVWAVVIIVVWLIVRAVIKASDKRRMKAAAKCVNPYTGQNSYRMPNPYPQGIRPEQQPEVADRRTGAGEKQDAGQTE